MHINFNIEIKHNVMTKLSWCNYLLGFLKLSNLCKDSGIGIYKEIEINIPINKKKHKIGFFFRFCID